MPQLKLIMGVKGSGKTKLFVDMVKDALMDEKGNIVCVERGGRMVYDLPHAVRLIESSEYGFDGYDFLKGFISGLRSGNYDITHIFIDSVLKIIGKELDDDAADFFDWCDAFGETHGVRFTLMVSADASQASDRCKKYF